MQHVTIRGPRSLQGRHSRGRNQHRGCRAGSCKRHRNRKRSPRWRRWTFRDSARHRTAASCPSTHGTSARPVRGQSPPRATHRDRRTLGRSAPPLAETTGGEDASTPRPECTGLIVTKQATGDAHAQIHHLRPDDRDAHDRRSSASDSTPGWHAVQRWTGPLGLKELGRRGTFRAARARSVVPPAPRARIEDQAMRSAATRRDVQRGASNARRSEGRGTAPKIDQSGIGTAMASVISLGGARATRASQRQASARVQAKVALMRGLPESDDERGATPYVAAAPRRDGHGRGRGPRTRGGARRMARYPASEYRGGGSEPSV